MSELLKLKNVRRSGKTVLALGLVSAVAACGSSKEQTTTGNKSNSNSASANVTVSNGNDSSYPKQPADFSWDKRVRLSANSYGKWDTGSPEPVRAAHLSGNDKYLLVVDDGRFNYPADPNPNTDTPTGLYSVPTQKSQPVTKVPDGTVLKVVGWTDNGQQVSDAHGNQGYHTWEEVVGHDGAKAWVPWVNVGYTALSQLHQLPSPPTGM